MYKPCQFFVKFIPKNFPQFVVIHTVKGFGKVHRAEVDVFLELSCFFYDLMDVGSLISGSSGCVSIPCWVPVRVAKDRSIPAWGDPFPGPEWTSLLRRREK